MSLDAMTLALEALESSRIFVTSREKIKHPEGTELYNNAITALRAAIEQTQPQTVPAESGLAEKVPVKGTLLEQTLRRAWDEMPHTALMDAIIGGTGVMLGDKRIDPASIYKQPEQEPVSFNHDIGSDRFKVVRGAFWWHVLIGDSPTEHGKFRSRAGAEKMAADLLREFRNGAFVQHTAPRQWQWLTEQEIKDCEKQAMVNGSLPFEQRSFFARAIETKLREKNT